MKIPEIPLAQTVILLFKSKGIKHVVISPGSRNAPLTIGFTNDPFFFCYSIVDERCAAFFALGMAQKLQEPVGILCTSGSACLNYYPAVAEAYYSNVPLIILTADRPKHLIDIGDGQTINQQNVFGEHVIYSANLKLDIKDEAHVQQHEELPIFKNLEHKVERFLGLQQDIETFNQTEIQKALEKALLHSAPVHLNIPFNEPLYNTVDNYSIRLKNEPSKIVEFDLDDYEIKDVLNEWKNVKRKMIIIGMLPPKAISTELLVEFANEESVIVFTEATSNIYHSNFFPCIDKIIAPLDASSFEALKPDILLTFGGMIVSKKIKAFLRKYQPKAHWHCGLNRANDTFFKLQRHFKVHPNDFLAKANEYTSHIAKSTYRSEWLTLRSHRRKMHNEYLQNIPFCDFKAFEIVLPHIPNNYQLQVGNSSAIRYVQLFEINKTLEVYCNRGTSGIDGSTSTAIGSAVVAKKPTVFVTGDLSFFYDSNALWNNYIPNSFRIILINNEGGGIFRILPGDKDADYFDRYFETKHELTAKQLCEMYQFEYAHVDNEAMLHKELTEFYTEGNLPKLLEIKTPSTLNDEILLRYFEFLKIKS